MRIPLIYKRAGNYLVAFLLSACCFFGSYLAFLKGSTELQQIDSYSGKVVNKGIISQKSTVARFGSYKSNVFFIKLSGLNQILATYNLENNYDFFEKNIKIGDSIKVYYQNSFDTIKPNLDLFQIEKNGTILLKKEDFQKKKGIAAYIAFFGGFLLIGAAIYQDKKYWK
ncbi:hypothetical protein [Flavobacterium difficile]|uniref:DUF3592 domain-containing protein n=1 Tax=Flavobacterium difficile TaxID=2709659 RepID=A0ABX0I641_9FLAO|nr:hypothetical protein [Flavobacterium difficile]NHM02374.1 hypothetical protein [Flavobacterium difficile]